MVTCANELAFMRRSSSPNFASLTSLNLGRGLTNRSSAKSTQIGPQPLSDNERFSNPDCIVPLTLTTLPLNADGFCRSSQTDVSTGGAPSRGTLDKTSKSTDEVLSE